MPKLKPSIKTEIFGIPYKVNWYETSKVDIQGQKALWGQIDYNSREIRLSKDIGDRDKLVTLFEEILHGVFNEMEYDHLNQDHKFISPLVNGFFTALEKVGMIEKSEG